VWEKRGKTEEAALKRGVSVAPYLRGEIFNREEDKPKKLGPQNKPEGVNSKEGGKKNT